MIYLLLKWDKSKEQYINYKYTKDKAIADSMCERGKQKIQRTWGGYPCSGLWVDEYQYEKIEDVSGG